MGSGRTDSVSGENYDVETAWGISVETVSG
jgi:hypothetical protein